LLICAKHDNKIDQCENLAKIFEALKENTSLSKLAIKLNSGVLNDSSEDIVFTDRSEELCSALDQGIAQNKNLTELHLVNLRLGGRLIDCIGKGLRVNNTLKILTIPGNQIVFFTRAK